VARFDQTGFHILQLKRDVIQQILLGAEIPLRDSPVGCVAFVHRQGLTDVDRLGRCERVIRWSHHALTATDLLVQMYKVSLLGVDGIQTGLKKEIGTDTHDVYLEVWLGAVLSAY